MTNLFKISKFLLTIILICGITISCSSFRKIEDTKDKISLTKENINLIDGLYLNNTDVEVLPMNYFWGKNYKMKEYESVYKLVYEQKKPYFINLKALNEKQIQVTIFVDNQILKSYILKGKLNNGYFEQKRKIYMIPMIIFNVYHNSKFRIGKLKNNNLITDYDQKEYSHYAFSFKNNCEKLENIEHFKVKNDTIK
jgi:hypothetical protein